ncbi:MAG: cysteine synthase A [Synergistetes bacterium]|nr:cysteine synthase A [Synergistota bacterium]
MEIKVNWERRGKVYENIAETVGFTPLVKLNRIPKEEGVDANIMVKIEYFSPSGSLKDRILYRIITEAIKKGELKPGMTIIEATTGNTGIATAMLGAVFGYPVKILIPEGMSEERMKVMRMYGAELIFTPGAESDVDITLQKLQEIVEKEPEKYFVVGQYTNPNNPLAHYYTTGPEIWEQTNGEIEAFVQTQGTGGTVSGIGRYLKERSPGIWVYTAEPAEAPFLSKMKWGSHRIEGIGDGFIPENLDLSVIDGVILTTSEEAIEMAKRLAREEGILCGISSGHNVAAAIKLAKAHPEWTHIVTMINDNGLRYFSTPLFGVEKQIEIPEREHEIRLSDKQKRQQHKLEIIE